MTPTMTPDVLAAVLDRAGHLSELALDRYRFDPPEPLFHEAVAAHLADCEACRRALEVLTASDETVVLSPPAVVIPIARKPRRSAWLAGGAVLALAAGALLLTRPWQPDDDVITLKGSPLDFEIYVHDGDKSRPVLDGDVVHPGERMGFRVHFREEGYLAIYGRDDRGTSYPCYPLEDAEGLTFAPTATALQAVAHPRSEHPLTLPVAMRFDDILGDEHITAVFCATPFSLGPAPVEMTAELARDGCHIAELTLHKRPVGEAP